MRSLLRRSLVRGYRFRFVALRPFPDLCFASLIQQTFTARRFRGNIHVLKEADGDSLHGGRRPAWAAARELRRREAAADAQLVELERARARARAERPYGKRRRVVEGARGRIHEGG